ncbi:MAG: PTS transporter subunit EIIC, partial [Tyzzerella sp.]|nr:PTS transporter subunit EIIC [Candidatus Fimicola merdigallinarum]
MKKEPKVSAKQVLEGLGGKDNIETVSHCATRLRLTVKDESIIDKKAVEDAEGASGYFVKSGQHQVIFGTGYVGKVCTEFKKLCGIDDDVTISTKETSKNNKNTNKFQDITRTISDVFIPIIPVLLATGILMGLQGLITTLGYNMSAEFNSIFSVLTGTAYTFIPVLVTWSACKKFGGSPVFGIVLGLMLVSPSLPDKWDVVNGVAEALKINIAGIDFNITGYQSSVIPALFLGWFCAFIENKLRKIVPDILEMLIVPFVTLLTSLLLG